MTNSFYQIEIDRKSKPLTIFTNSNGHYQYPRLPFVSKISSNSSQRMVTIALAGLGSDAFLHVDDNPRPSYYELNQSTAHSTNMQPKIECRKIVLLEIWHNVFRSTHNTRRD